VFFIVIGRSGLTSSEAVGQTFEYNNCKLFSSIPFLPIQFSLHIGETFNQFDLSHYFFNNVNMTDIRTDSLKSPVDVAEYLFTRLHQIGVRSIHGVPGDYNLVALDYVDKTGSKWVGNVNELNAGNSRPKC
jgi:hypothetical protein